jgi:hypothetical protein
MLVSLGSKDGEMRKASFRTAFTLLIVSLFATSSFAQYPGCYQCGTAGDPGDTALFCVTADGWGGEECNVTVVNGFARCRVSGYGCYAMEVR